MVSVEFSARGEVGLAVTAITFLPSFLLILANSMLVLVLPDIEPIT